MNKRLIFYGISPLLFCLFTLLHHTPGFAQPWSQIGADINGEETWQSKGQAVSISSDGSRVAVGGSGANNIAGRVEVYEFNGCSWTQLGADIDGEADYDNSGVAVSLSSDGSRVAIGASGNDGNGDVAGHVRIFEYSGGVWTQLGADIDGRGVGDLSGISVSLNSDGSRVAIGAPDNYNSYGDDDSTGYVRLFEYNGSSWVQLGSDITGEAAGDDFGCSVSLNSAGSRVAIGGRENDGSASNAGHVRLYEYNGSNWVQLGADLDGVAAEDLFGYSVSLDSAGSKVAISAPYNDENGDGAGEVRIYEYNGSNWTQLGGDINGLAATSQCGFSLDISSDGSRVVIGEIGYTGSFGLGGVVRTFEYNGSSWSQVEDGVEGEGAFDQLGWSVSINNDGSRVVMGSMWHTANEISYCGYARVFSTQAVSPCTQATELTFTNQGNGEIDISWTRGDGQNCAVFMKATDSGNPTVSDESTYAADSVFSSGDLDDGSSWYCVYNGTADSVTLTSVSEGFTYRVQVFEYNGAAGGEVYLTDEDTGNPANLELPYQYTPHSGYALEFDGTDDYVNIPSTDLNFSGTSMTLEAWIYPTAWATNVYDGCVVVKEDFSMNGYMLRVGNNGQAQFTLGNGSSWYDATSSTGVLSLNKWQHLAGVVDAGSMTLYLDGKEIATGTLTGSFVGGTDPLWLGRDYNYPTRTYTGKIDEVRIWNDARTLAEIQANMHKELTGGESNLLAYYAMYDGSGTSLTDNSSNGYTGTLNNGPGWVTSGAHAGPRMTLDFDGSNEYVSASLSMPDTGVFTIETWVSFSSLGGQENFLTLHQGAGSYRIILYKGSDNEIYFYAYDGSFYNLGSNFTVSSADTWHHLAVVYNNGEVTIYVDGNETESRSGQGSFTTSAPNNFYIGADLTAPGYYSDVRIDELRVWSDVRTQAEIRAYKDHTLDADEENLEAYYRFDQQADASNSTLYDVTANANDGTLTNMDPTTDWVASDPFNTWIGSDDSDWSNADNWSLAAVPGSEDVGIFEWGLSNTPTNANITGRHFYLDQGVTMNTTGDLTLSGDYYNAGTFTTTGDVTFSGSSAQTIRGTGTSTFGAFIVNNAAGVTMEQDIEATSGLTLTAGLLQLGSQTLTLGTGASVSGTPGTTNHVVATSGTLRKGYSGTGSFSFPVGDGTTYSPISLNFTSGVFASAYADVSLTASKHPNNSSSNHYIERYWTVSSSGISSFDCTVTGTYDDGDIQGTESELYGGKWNGASWNVLAAANTGSNQFSGTVSSFSDFTAGEIGTFPVEWLSFEATPTGQSVQLDWSTGTEQNSYFFAIERSADEEFWNEIGQIPAAGNSEMVRQYQFTDQQPDNGLNYYRLRQVDLDGTQSYSEVRSVSFQELGIRAFPNPVENTLHLDLPTGDWKAELLDGLGRSLLSVEQVGRELDLSQLPSGTYQLRLSGSEGQQWNTTVVK